MDGSAYNVARPTHRRFQNEEYLGKYHLGRLEDLFYRAVQVYLEPTGRVHALLLNAAAASHPTLTITGEGNCHSNILAVVGFQTAIFELQQKAHAPAPPYHPGVHSQGLSSHVEGALSQSPQTKLSAGRYAILVKMGDKVAVQLSAQHDDENVKKNVARVEAPSSTTPRPDILAARTPANTLDALG